MSVQSIIGNKINSSVRLRLAQPQGVVPLNQKKASQTPYIPDNFQTNIKQKKSAASKGKKILPVIIGASAIIAAGAAVYFKRDKIKDFMQLSGLKKLSSELDKKYPQDALYRKKIASALGFSPEESYKINTIGGAQEFKDIVQRLSSTAEAYSPGTPKFRPDGSIESFGNTNVLKRTFEANMHMHTINSDGSLTVQALLDQAARYADERFEKFKKPFIVAITDHDTLEGCRQAVDIVSKSPEKYKNLRLFLGCENTTIYKNAAFLSQDAQIHVLSYGLNPFSDEITEFLTKRIEKNQANIKKVISNANSMFSDMTKKLGFEYDFDDMTKMAPGIGVGLKNSGYYMKDYLQLKPIYEMTVNKNEKICSQLSRAGIDISEINYALPIKMIPENPDYSKGQKYYEYYHEALKNYITSRIKEKNPAVAEDEIKKCFPAIDKEMAKMLQTIEKKVPNETSSLYVEAPEYLRFGECVSKLASLDDGLIGIAHPGVFFPMKSCGNQDNVPKIYEKIYSVFKNKGGERAAFAEDHYQSYFNNNREKIIAKLREISSSHKLLPTGGLDTHGLDIFNV